MRRFRLPSLATITTAAVLLSAASLAGVAGPAQPAGAASTACPWVGSSAPISQRVSQVMARMTTAQKVDLLTGASRLQLRRLHPGHRVAVHPGDQPGGRPGRGRRRHDAA